ncbi:MAG: cyclase family protein [Gemmatimonadota bacterium]|nr:cyclase family protein [Gemmatimonadota bacterium]
MESKVSLMLVFACAAGPALTGCSPTATPGPDGAGAAGFGNADQVAAAFSGLGGRWVDLSHDYSDETIYWPTDSLGFQFEELAYGETDLGYFYSAYRFATAEHGGTHLDAPIHFSRGADAVDEIPLDRLLGPAVVVDVTDHVTPDYLVSVADFEAFETEHGRIPDGSILLIRTGWSERWPDREAYLGTPLEGAAAIPELHFPGIAPDAARWLAENRSIDALGIDTPSIDHGQSADFETHVVLYGAGIPGLENVTNVGELPETGSYVLALPMKIAGGSGAPVRIVAFVPE